MTHPTSVLVLVRTKRRELALLRSPDEHEIRKSVCKSRGAAEAKSLAPTPSTATPVASPRPAALLDASPAARRPATAR